MGQRQSMADYQYITSTGVILPDTSVIRDEVESEWRAAFGQDLVVTSETPQGAMITIDVESRDGMVRNNAELANQINPDIAGGIYLDAIWALTRGRRRSATRSVLSGVEFRGIPGTIIPSRSVAVVETTGARFLTSIDLVIGPAGLVTGQMVAEDTGPVAAPAGTLTQVASSVLGWEQVTNPTSAALGADRETDIASRKRRRNTLALQSISLPEAVISRVYGVDGVRSLSFRDNDTNTTQVIDGVSLVPHSVWVCVDGGEETDIATALLASKTGGAGWNGDVLVSLIEPASGQAYAVRFDRPQELNRILRITVKPTTLDAQTIILQAIQQYQVGELDGEDGLVVGEDLSPFEIAGAINEVEPRIFVKKVESSVDGLSWSTAIIDASINQVFRIVSTQVVFES